jgi:hypothetical protein
MGEMEMNDIMDEILSIIESQGFIMLNDNPKYPSICGMGGGWSESIYLINSRGAFLTKLIEDKTTLISPKLYFSIRACQKNMILNDDERIILDFIRENEPVDMKMLKFFITNGDKEIKKALNSLQNKLLITVLGEGKRISDSWGTYLWGTSQTWESGLGKKPECENPELEVKKLLSGKISPRKLMAIINGSC